MNFSQILNIHHFYIGEINYSHLLTKDDQEKISNIKKNLTIDTKTLTKNTRKKISAADHRPSSKAVGSILGIGILIATLLVIVVPDIPTLVRHFKKGPEYGAPRRVKKGERVTENRNDCIDCN